jgi:hypothetical protein
VFGTIWDIGEAAGPMIAGFLIGRLGFASTFDVLAAITALITLGPLAIYTAAAGFLGSDPREKATDREPEECA